MFKISVSNLFSKIITNVSFNQDIFGQKSKPIFRQNKHAKSLANLKVRSEIRQSICDGEKIVTQHLIHIIDEFADANQQTVDSVSMLSQISFQQHWPDNEVLCLNQSEKENICNQNNNLEQQCECISQKRCEYADKWLSFNKNRNIPKQTQIRKSILSQIDKDVVRTNVIFPINKKNAIREQLKKLLILYCIQDPEVSYIQGFNNIMGVLLSHTKNITEAFYLFRFLLQDKFFRVLYVKNFSHAKKHSVKICGTLSKKSRKIYDHMVFRLKIQLPLFIIGWIIPLFTNIVPKKHISKIFDGLFKYSWVFLYIICLQVIIHMKQEILQSDDKQEVEMLLTVQSLSTRFSKWKEVIEQTFRIVPLLEPTFATPY